MFKYDYFLDPAACFRNWNQAKLQPAPANVRWLYVAVLGWYFEALFQCTMIGKSKNCFDRFEPLSAIPEI